MRILLALVLCLFNFQPAISAVRLDATTDHFSRAESPPPTTSFTVMGWFKISVDRNSWSTFLDNGNDGGDTYTIQTGSNGTTLVIWTGDGETSGSALVVGRWYHIAMTVNGTSGNSTLGYINGVLNITAPTVSNADGPVQIGESSGGGESLNGCAAAIKFYNRALTAAEIANEMKSYMPRSTQDLNSWYPMLTHHDSVIDKSGAGLTFTANGTHATEDGPPISWR